MNRAAVISLSIAAILGLRSEYALLVQNSDLGDPGQKSPWGKRRNWALPAARDLLGGRYLASVRVVDNPTGSAAEWAVSVSRWWADVMCLFGADFSR